MKPSTVTPPFHPKSVLFYRLESKVCPHCNWRIAAAYPVMHEMLVLNSLSSGSATVN